MSQYEDYSKVSDFYDNERKAVGVDIIVGLLQVYAGKPLKDLHLLDAGCGTGNYAKALTDYGVGKVTLLDGSPDMLSVAKNKLRDEIAKKVVDKAVEAKMPALLFDDGSFDVVFSSAVLHHLDEPSTGEKYPMIERMFHEAKRVLRPKGVLVIGESLPLAVKKGLWYFQLNDDLCERISKIFPTMEHYNAMFDNSGFKLVTKLNVLGPEMLTHYYDPEGPLKQEWRKGDSLFGFATEQEIQDIEQKVREMNEKGTIGQYIKEHDKTSEIGILTLLACISLKKKKHNPF